MGIIPTMQQILDGLHTFNLISVIRSNPVIFKYVFCPSKELVWSFEYVEPMLSPIFSEIDCYKSLVDGLENVFHCEGINFKQTFFMRVWRCCVAKILLNFSFRYRKKINLVYVGNISTLFVLLTSEKESC